MKRNLSRSFKGRILAFGAALGLSVVLASTTSAATVTMGFDRDATLKGAVRYRNFGSGGGAEIRLGTSDGSGGIASPAEGNCLSRRPVDTVAAPRSNRRRQHASGELSLSDGWFVSVSAI
jgi:hypothetical protein